MKYLIVLFFPFLACSSSPIQYSDTPISHEIWNSLVKEFVSSEGKVNYQEFQKDSIRLNEYLALLSNNHPSEDSWSKEQRLAYWINAYNAFTVKLILKNYPLKSIKDITAINIPFVHSPWNIKFFKIGGKKYNLNNIEHDILREKFDEPRIHFAINCASESCPRLLNEAFTVEKLEQQLQAQAIEFINDPAKNNITKNKLELSKIFSWFKGDFTKNGTLINFLNQYANLEISPSAKVKYQKYDWQLNE